ncbi:hypothetical protein [Cupriavidus basilensis]|uniref:hypothetical protein n=1 Tax=Cupriavidus basilensis TaxID=68895 RepID=UPI001185A88C|nr:hypothetical protein [Cupriavidus basilensis]
METLRRALFFIIWFVWSVPAVACSLGFLGYSPVFDDEKPTLSANEVLRLADWRARLRIWLPNGGKYHITVNRNEKAGVSAGLAEQRRQSLTSLLLALGIEPTDIEESVVKGYRLDIAGPWIRPDLNRASIEITEPRCPHGCCPGPQPMVR